MQRELTGFEKAFCLSEPLVPMNFVMVAQFSVAPLREDLRQVLLRMSQRYSMAAMRVIRGADGQPTFTDVGVPAFPLVVLESSLVAWQEVAIHELEKNFDLQSGPLVRLTLLKHADGSADLILTFHHGIADGMSGVFFLQDMLLLLDDVEAALEPVPETPDINHIIPAEERHAFSVKMQILGMKVGLRIVKLLNRFGKGFPVADRLIESKFPWEHIALSTHCLSPTQTKELVKHCKQEGTSVHAAISVAWLRARNELIGDVRKWKRKLSSPVDLRGYRGTGNAFGNIMSNAIVTVDCSPDRDFWDVAREFKFLIVENIKSGRVYHWIAQMHGIMDLPEVLIKMMVPSFATPTTGLRLFDE